MEIEHNYMRPVILHGFGASAKRRMPERLRDLAASRLLPMAVSLFGTPGWCPQWMHPHFLPVIGLRLHAKLGKLPNLTLDPRNN